MFSKERENEIDFLQELLEVMCDMGTCFDLHENHAEAHVWEAISVSEQEVVDLIHSKVKGWISIAEAHNFRVEIKAHSYQDVYEDGFVDGYLVLIDKEGK